MRKSKKLAQRVPLLLQKSLELYRKGKTNALVIETKDRIRLDGKQMRALTIDENNINFVMDDGDYIVPINTISAVARLRTRRHVFYAEGVKEDLKAKKQAKPKAKKETTNKKQDKEA